MASAARAENRGSVRPARSQLLRLILVSRERVAINQFPSINHAYHHDGFHVPGFHGERQGERKDRFLEAHADRMSRGGRLAAVPDCAGIVERLEGSIPILDAVVDQAVPSNWVNIVLIPASSVLAVAYHEEMRLGCLATDRSGLYLVDHLVLAVSQPVMKAHYVRGVREIRPQELGGRTQGIRCIHLLWIFRIRQPALIAQSRYQGVGGLVMSGRVLVLKALKSYPDLECQRLGKGYGGGGFKILPRTVGLGGLAGLGCQGVQGTLIPLLVIALELESQAHPIIPHVLVFVAGVD